MKKFQFLIVFVGVIGFTGFSMTDIRATFQEPDSLVIATEDSTEYEVIIFDSGFKSWLLTNAKPIGHHTNEYYRNKNMLLIAEWNSRVRSNRYRPPYEYEIDYSPFIDYGIEVNYQLYWYFKYMEQKFGFNLFGPRNRY